MNVFGTSQPKLRIVEWSGLGWLLALSISSFGCGPGETNDLEPSETETAQGEVSSAAPTPVNVTSTRLTPATLRERVTIAGRLEPWTEVHVATELGGTVQGVRFDKGQRVRKGQELARVGTDLLEAALSEAEAELEGAKAVYDKTVELFERQAVPRQTLTSATSDFKRAEARVEQAKLRVARSILRAPIGGVAIDREIEVGEVVSPGAHVTTIHETSRLKGAVGIPEDDISFFHAGGDATVEVDAYAGEEFEGRIHFIAPAATGPNRSFLAEVAIPNTSGRLKPGMIARVALVKRVFEDAVVVPRDAILERDRGNVAFVVNGERAELRNIRTGPSEGSRIVVVDGLRIGDELIVTGQRNLVDGQAIRVVPKEEATAALEARPDGEGLRS